MNPIDADPLRNDQPFNRLMDLADVRGCQVGLRVGELERTTRGEYVRPVVAIELLTADRSRKLVEPVDHQGLQHAAGGLLPRLQRSEA